MKIEELLKDAKKISSKEKKLEKLPVTKDIPRLAKKFHIFVNEKEIPVISSEEESLEDATFNIFKILGKELQNVDLDKTEFSKKVLFTSHFSLTEYMLEKFGETGITTCILKSCHQGIIANCLHGLKSTMINDKVDVPIRDVRGAWKIFVHIKKDKNGNLTFISTTHERQEYVYDKIPSTADYINYFRIIWEFVSIYNVKSFEIENAEMNLLDIIYEQKEFEVGSKDKANIIRQIFKNSKSNIDHSFDPKWLQQKKNNEFYMKIGAILVLIFTFLLIIAAVYFLYFKK
jgi:hypothetical protein